MKSFFDSAIAALKKRLATLDSDRDRTLAVLRVLSNPKLRPLILPVRLTKSPTGEPNEPSESGRRRNRVRYKLTCQLCGKPFRAKKSPSSSSSSNMTPKYCHKPCTSSRARTAHLKAQGLTTRGTKPIRSKPVILLKGDSLSTSH